MRADSQARKAEFARLGVRTQADVKDTHSLFGRTAQLPWCIPEILELHPYLEADSVLLVPPAHNVLRGPIRGVMSFAVTTTSAELVAMGIDPQDHPVVFTSEQKRSVQVC